MALTIENAAEVQVQSLQDVRRAAEALQREVSSVLDYRIAPWHDIASRRPMTDADGKVLLVDIFGWPVDPKEQWWSRSPRTALDQGSPIVAACRFESEPFWCNGDGCRTRAPNPFLKQVNFNNFLDRSGLHAALVMPVHLPFGQIGVISFSPLDLTTSDLERDFVIHSDILSLFSHRFISSYVYATLSDRRAPVEAYRSLTRREVECLHWASLGKTNEDITMILSLSLSTVRFHISNAAIKLAAVNRGQAITNAARMGYIKLPS